MATFNNPRKTAATVTASAILAKGFHTPVDATSGLITVTLPTGTPAGVEISVEKVDTSANAVVVSGTMRGAGGSTISLTYQYEGRTFLSEGNGSWRPTSDHRTSSTLNTIVTGALASDTTAKNAAAAAVSAQLAQAGTLTGATTVGALPGDEIFVVKDSANRKSWLAIAEDGGPPDRVKGLLTALSQSAQGFTVVRSDVLGRSFNVMDASGREAFWIDESGAFGWYKTSPDTMSRLAAALTAAGFGAIPTQYQDWRSSQHRTAAGPNIVCWGDSLTAGAGSGTLPTGGGTITTTGSYPTVLQGLLNTRLGTGVSTVYNAGVGGETSPTITARANATPITMLPASGTTLAASGATQVNLQNINGQTPRPLLQGSGGGSTGVLYVKGVAVPGTIGLVQPGGANSSFTNGTDYYTFTPTTSLGSPMTFDRPAAFVYDFANAHRDDIHIICIGQNGPSDARAKTDTAAIIQRMTALDKRFIVVAKPSNNDADDSAWHDLYARRYFALRRYLVDYGMSDAGLTPTTQDNTDIAAGNVPTSLRIDSVHGNAAYYNIWGTQVFNRLVEMGWV